MPAKAATYSLRTTLASTLAAGTRPTFASPRSRLTSITLSEARLRTAAVRYASVGAGFQGPCGPRTEADRPSLMVSGTVPSRASA